MANDISYLYNAEAVKESKRVALVPQGNFQKVESKVFPLDTRHFFFYMPNDDSNSSKPVAVSTLFVGNLPRNATSKQLEEFFSDIGPIRNCFVVADRSKGKVKEDDPQFQNKGVGYVHFAVTDDAQQAMEKLKNAKFLGRRLKLDYAQRKSALGEKRQKPSSALAIPEEPNKKARTRAARLIVRNLPWKYNEDDLRRIFSEHGQVEDVSLPRKFPGGPLRGFGFVQFGKVKDAETVCVTV